MRRILTIVLASLLLLIVLFAAYVYVTNRPLPQNEDDVAILEKAIELLDDESIWSRDDDRTCNDSKQGLSLYCALRQASVDVTGEFKHRAAALQAVRFAIENQRPDKNYAHRLMDYNNDTSVDFEELHEMLQASSRKLREDWQAIEDQRTN